MDSNVSKNHLDYIDELFISTNNLANLKMEVSANNKEIDELKKENDANQKLKTMLIESHTAYQNILSSTSWKITHPLRMFMECLRELKSKN